MPLKSTKSTKKKVINKVISENIKEEYNELPTAPLNSLKNKLPPKLR